MSLLQFITVKNRTEALRISDFFIPVLFHIHLLNPHTQARFTTLPSFGSFVNCAYVPYSPQWWMNSFYSKSGLFSFSFPLCSLFRFNWYSFFYFKVCHISLSLSPVLSMCQSPSFFLFPVLFWWWRSLCQLFLCDCCPALISFICIQLCPLSPVYIPTVFLSLHSQLSVFLSIIHTL